MSGNDQHIQYKAPAILFVFVIHPPALMYIKVSDFFCQRTRSTLCSETFDVRAVKKCKSFEHQALTIRRELKQISCHAFSLITNFLRQYRCWHRLTNGLRPFSHRNTSVVLSQTPLGLACLSQAQATSSRSIFILKILKAIVVFTVVSLAYLANRKIFFFVSLLSVPSDYY